MKGGAVEQQLIQVGLVGANLADGWRSAVHRRVLEMLPG